MSSTHNVLREGAEIAESSDIVGSYIAHATIGEGCQIHHCHIQGTPEAPIVVEAGATLIQCELVSAAGPHSSFSFGGVGVTGAATRIGRDTRLFGVRVENSVIGEGVEGKRCHVLNSVVDGHCKLRPHGSLTLSHVHAHCNLGSEVSKSVLAEGFTSEHTASYLSLIAPSSFPILDAEGRERVIEGLPNLTNIGAGTVFANYSGKPKPAGSLSESSGSLKGTSIAYSAFTAVNSVIVNRYGSAREPMPLDWMRRRDLTILGFACFVERKVTGRIPAFSYAGGTQADDIKLGWVLERQPGIVLNIFKKMRKRLGEHAGRLAGLIEGTIRLERRLLQEQREERGGFYSHEMLDEALALYERQLDGRWAIDTDGTLQAEWYFDEDMGRWSPR